MDDYYVFLNYRSLDARDFVSHLYVTLKSAGLSPFMYRKCLVKGFTFLRSIDAALEVAQVHVAVVSGRYAESKLCLSELVAMLRSGKRVIPVFYDVEPRNLREVENGLFGPAFKVHKRRETAGQVEEWEAALRKLADISALQLCDYKGDEAALVQKVVDVVMQNSTGWLGLVPSTVVWEASAAMNDYGVFINHHGRDVRGCFASHLYAALQSAGLSPFLEKESLVMADDGLRSINALEMARVHVAVVSEGYAESKLCLSELVAMMRSGKPVIPLFYNVESAHLRHVEKGLFAAAFGKHKQREPREQVEEWVDALRKLADISGFRFRLDDDSRDAAELVQEVVDTLMLMLRTSTGVGGPCSVNAGHDYSESSATEWASTRSDGLDFNGSAQVGNAAAMEELGLYLRLGEDCMGAVQRISSHTFNNEQCGYLADKLQMVVRSASLYLNVLRGDVGPCMDVAKVVEVFKFLLALAKQIESFVQGCCKDSWIQSAMTLTNVWEYVASVGFNLELCRVAFCMECAATRCLTLDEVEEIYNVEVEVVKKKAFSDVDALSQKILLEGPSLSNENKDLAFYLLRRLNQVKPIPGAIVELSEGSTGYDGGWIGRLFEWVKPREQLGRGASGTVHKAMWLGTPVARKSFDGKENPDFMKEVEVLSALSHPNVMSVFCSGKTSRGCCSIIMDLMHEDLHILMERRLEEKSSSSFGCPSPFPILGAVDIMLQIGEGGKYLHDQRIVHRDLKSMNILTKNWSGEDLDGYVHVKVADFGLSKTKEKSIRYSSWTYNVGSSRWMAPEIIRLSGSDQGSSSSIEGRKHPFKRDIYSFGMVCFEILTGHVPFSNHGEREVKRRVLQGERPELPKDPHMCPPLLKELIESCWSSNPEERPTFMAICSALKYLKYLLMRSCETIKKAEQ